ncbi:MAG: hypothetical protein LBH08_01415 [Puniceicoccales bacterium]|jgi:hypothetical protein|nr:hypothetical protein [Puniceicoccales bacterium]
METATSNAIITASNIADIKGNSVVDVKAQETLDIGTPPIVRELRKRPIEKSMEENQTLGNINNQSEALTVDANVIAKQLIGLDGLPE